MKGILLVVMITVVCERLSAQTATPKLAIDHIIIWTQKGAPEIKLFEEKGFTISPLIMVHTGMGTGGRYINFYNVYFEFLYLNDSATTDPRFKDILGVRGEKIQEKGKSPFGLGLYMIPYDTARIPFAARAIHAPWMRPNTSVYFASSNVKYEQEPYVLLVPPYMEVRKWNSLNDIDKMVSDTATREWIRKSVTHRNGVQKLTSVKITCKTKNFSSTVKALREIQNLIIVKGKEYLLEMTFDENRQSKTIDYRPKLPIVIKY